MAHSFSSPPLASRPPARRLRGILLCLHCGERRRVELLHGDVLVLDRNGTLTLPCPACALSTHQALIRLGD